MKHTWTTETAYNYVEMWKDDPNRGLKYCSALDYLNNHASAAKLAALKQKTVAALTSKPKKKKKRHQFNQSKHQSNRPIPAQA